MAHDQLLGPNSNSSTPSSLNLLDYKRRLKMTKDLRYPDESNSAALESALAMDVPMQSATFISRESVVRKNITLVLSLSQLVIHV